MQSGFQYIDILIFGVIAIFLIFRLKNILGTKTDFEDNNVSEKNNNKNFSNIIPIKNEIKSRHQEKVDKILKIDPSFNLEDFLSGSKKFFNMVLEGFVSCNLDNIKNYIKPSVLNSFKKDIEERNKEKETLIIDLKSIEKNEIISINLTKTIIRISVVFESLQIRALLDKNGKIIDGDTNKEFLVKDEWTFEKKMASDNLDWTLIETKSI